MDSKIPGISRIPHTVPTAARRQEIRNRRSHAACDCGAAELLDYVEFLEAELVRVTQRLETLEARLSRNPSVTRFRPGD